MLYYSDPKYRTFYFESFARFWWSNNKENATAKAIVHILSLVFVATVVSIIINGIIEANIN